MARVLGAVSLAALSWVPAAAAAQSQTPEAVTATADAASNQPAAKPGAADNMTTYDQAYFAQYAPTTALQMVQRVPGFVIEDTDQGVRGFGQAAGNVVINGQRPSSKTDALTTLLERIPAGRVLRVELAPGERFGAEYSAKAQVVNLVLIADAGVSGTITATARRDFTGRVLPGGAVSALVKRGKSTFNLSATIINERGADEGTDTFVTLPDEALIEFRRKLNLYRNPNGALAAGWSHDAGPNRTAHLNLRYAADRLRLNQDADVVTGAGARRDDAIVQRFRLDDYEVGGDITRPFAGGGLKLIALATRRARDNRELQLFGIGGAAQNGFTQAIEDTLDERLGRVVWSRSGLGKWTVEAGGEAVVNRLDSRVVLTRLLPGGGSAPIDLPVDDAVVTERRGEAFVTAGRVLGKGLRGDFGLTYETSYLTVRGDAMAERRLSFLKPRVTLDWRPSKWRGQFSLQRTVNQLQFQDFISSAELSNDRVNGGNPDLVPQRAWEALLTVERPVLGDGLIKLELGYNRLSLVQDRVPTPDGFDAPGNLGDGTVFIVRPRIDLPLGKLGVKGGRLSSVVSYVSTSVVDPYTGRDRRFSGNAALFTETVFRQDRGKLAWGLTIATNSAFTIFRRNEEDRVITRQPRSSAFVEWRPDKATTLNLTVLNLLDRGQDRERLFYLPDRRTAVPSQREYRERNQHVVPVLTLKRNFG